FSSQIGVVDLTADKKPGTPRNVSQVREGANPIWTADGTEILFIDGNLTSDGGVSRVRADGNGTPQRIGGRGYATAPAISRAGRQVHLLLVGPRRRRPQRDLADARRRHRSRSNHQKRRPGGARHTGWAVAVLQPRRRRPVQDPPRRQRRRGSHSGGSPARSWI